jgi:hypothetical protein
MLPEHHLSPESKDVVKLAMGLIATMAARVLGLLTASAKSSFDLQNAETVHTAADIIRLDRALARYGSETKEIRDLLKRAVAFRIQLTWPEDGSATGKLDSPEMTRATEASRTKFANSLRVTTPSASLSPGPCSLAVTCWQRVGYELLS